MTNLTKYLLIACSVLLGQWAHCQKLDSLRNQLDKVQGTDQASTLIRLGTLLAGDKPDTAIVLAQQALSILQRDPSKKEHYEAYELLGRVYMNTDNYPEAMAQYLKAYDVAEDLNNKEYQASTYSNMAYIYYNQKKLPEALEYMEKALVIFKESGQPKRMASTHNNMGVLYEELKDYDKALEHYKKALEISTEIGNHNSVANINTNMGNVHLRQSHYDAAFGHFKNALNIYDSLGNKKGLATAWCNLSQLYMNHKNAKAAITAADSSIYFSEQVGSLKDRRESYGVLHKAYQAQGNYKAALAAHEQHLIFKDSMFTTEKERVLAEMESKFENKLKAKEISQLKTENALQTRVTYWTIAFAIAVSVGLVMVFITLSLRNKLLNKKNLELEAEQKIAALEKEKLLMGLDYKNRQVVSHAVLMAQKNEVLHELKDRVKKIAGDDKVDLAQELKGLVRSINNHLELSDDWEQIKLHFDEVAPQFFQSLHNRYPGLTPHEQKLCAYTRMKMSTKEISRLLNIEPESVRMLRYRLRKKMMLAEEENMQEFLQQI
jgi:tetratricopeptide (TPR) repeat protein